MIRGIRNAKVEIAITSLIASKKILLLYEYIEWYLDSIFVHRKETQFKIKIKSNKKELKNG